MDFGYLSSQDLLFYHCLITFYISHSSAIDYLEPAPVPVKEERIPRHLIKEQATPYLPPPTTFPPDQWGNRIPDFSHV